MSTRATIEKFWNFLLDGNFPAAFDMFAEEGSYTVGGKTPASKEYAPKTVINGEFMEVIGSLFVNGPPAFSTDDIIVEGDRGVIIAKGVCEGAYGRYEQVYCFYVKVKGDEILSVVERVDSVPIETALMGGKLVRKDGTVVV